MSTEIRKILTVAAMIVGLVKADEVLKEPLSCMTASPVFGASEGTQFSDWKLID